MVRQGLHDPTGSSQPEARPGEHVLSSSCDEAVDKVLCQHLINIADVVRRAQTAVLAGVVDIDVKSVLVGSVAESPGNACAEVAASRAAQVSDEQFRGARVRAAVFSRDAQYESDQSAGRVAAPTRVGLRPPDGVPRCVVRTRSAKRYAVKKAARCRCADGARAGGGVLQLRLWRLRGAVDAPRSRACGRRRRRWRRGRCLSRHRRRGTR